MFETITTYLGYGVFISIGLCCTIFLGLVIMGVIKGVEPPKIGWEKFGRLK